MYTASKGIIPGSIFSRTELKEDIYIYMYKHSQMGRGENKGGKEDEFYFLY